MKASEIDARAECSAPPAEAPTDQQRHGVFALLPPDIGADLAARLEGIPGTSVPPQGYHITLYGPFVFQGNAQAARMVLRTIMQSVPSFTASLQRIGHFRRPDDNVVFAYVDCSLDLLQLHARLVNALDHLVSSRHPRGPEWDRWDYIPHVSLGVHLSDDDLETCLRRLSGLPLAYRFEVRHIWLLRESMVSPQSWVAEERYDLC